MTINLTPNKPKAIKRAVKNPMAAVSNMLGFWGTVTEVHPENLTCHVVMASGYEIANVRVLSNQWVTVDDDKGFLSGERFLPPVDTFVLCVCPTGDFDDVVIVGSGFAREAVEHADFKMEGEDAAATHERVNNSGWVYKSDYRNGTTSIQNDTENPTISVEVNQGENGEKADSKSVTIKVFDTTITATQKDDAEVKIETLGNTVIDVKEDTIDFSTDSAINFSTKGDQTLTIEGNATLEVKGDCDAKVSGAASVKSDKDASIEAQNILIKAAVKTEIKGGQVLLGGSVSPSGQGALCALPTCAFSGAPHVGNMAANA